MRYLVLLLTLCVFSHLEAKKFTSETRANIGSTTDTAQRIGVKTKEGLQKFLGSAKTVGEVKWESWGRLPKVTRSGNEYAKIGDRLYPKHAVERMMPIRYGTAGGVKGVAGRGVPPMVVEHTIRHGVRMPDQVVKGVTREVWKLGDIEVITEDAGKIIVTIMRKSQ